MTLPRSFLAGGFLSAGDVRKHRRLMIGSDGPSDSGKTEFALSAPGPGIVLALDRGFDSMLDNQTPPPTRRDDYGFKVIPVPLATQLQQSGYKEYWQAFYKEWRAALDNADCRTVVLDGDSESWELQRLAEFGRLTKVPSIMYDTVNAARRAMYARAYDSGKIIIATNRVGKSYRTKLKADGTPELNNSGNEVREWDGDYERKGFSDQDYLFQIQLRHLYNPDKGIWGIRILKCKADPALVGAELWGADCNFQALVQNVYPKVTLKEWGY